MSNKADKTENRGYKPLNEGYQGTGRGYSPNNTPKNVKLPTGGTGQSGKTNTTQNKKQ